MRPYLRRLANQGYVGIGDASAARDRVENFIQLGIDEGGTLLADGRGFTVPGFEQGFYLGPTLFDNITTDMTIYREEVFGPVLCIKRSSL